MALDFLAGCVGGAAGVIVGHPLDTVKVRLQTQSPTNIKYKGTYHCLSTIIKQESVAGLYKGISSPLFGVAGVNAIIFGVYGALRPYVSGSPGNDTLSAHFAAGSISGAVQSVVASPMELVKTRMQISEDSAGKKQGPVDVLKGIYKNEGGLLRGVFKGWGITLGREVPGFGFYFASYEALTRLGDGEVGTLGMMLAGGMAGVISWIVTFPIDVVKTRLQCDDRGKYNGVVDCIRKTYAAEGHKAFSRGLLSTVIRAFPTNAATFTVVTWIMRFAGETPQEEIQNTRQYLDELLKETSHLQERLDDSLRLKVPQYLLHGSSLTSSSLASQCAASAQRYVDKTQVYFNFYQSLQQQQASITEKVNTVESEEEVEEESVGVENTVSLLHEKLAVAKPAVSNTYSSSREDKVACISSSNRSHKDASVVLDEHDNHCNTTRHINHIASSPAPQPNENQVERETGAECVNTTSCLESETPLATNAALHEKNSSAGLLTQGSGGLSHEATSFPVQRNNSDINITAFAANDKHLDTSAIDSPKNAVDCLNSYSENGAMSNKELTYLSSSLDIPVHIIQAASLQDKFRNDADTVVVAETQRVTLKRPGKRIAPGKSSKAAEVWRNYCKTPALNFCKCFEDQCVCYI